MRKTLLFGSLSGCRSFGLVLIAIVILLVGFLWPTPKQPTPGQKYKNEVLYLGVGGQFPVQRSSHFINQILKLEFVEGTIESAATKDDQERRVFLEIRGHFDPFTGEHQIDEQEIIDGP